MTAGARWLIGMVLLLLLAAAGYWAGDHNRNNAWLAKQAKVEREAHVKYEAEVKRGEEAAGNYLGDLKDREDKYEELDKKFAAMRQRVPLLVSPTVVGETPAAAAGPEPGVHPPGAPTPMCIQGAIKPELTYGAVWMWNSALVGADVPAGACGADAASSEACAAGSGLTTQDAWDNHTVNARSWAKDRLRCERLIDYLEGRTP